MKAIVEKTALFSGAQLALEDMVIEHQPVIRRVALRLTGNAEDAADLVQDAFLRAVRYFKNFRPGSNFKAWILTILKSAHIDEVRRRRRRPKPVEVETLELADAGESSSAVGPLPSAEFAIEESIDDGLLEAIYELPAEFRETFLLAVLQDRPYDDIARQLNCPSGTVKSRVFRSRNLLRKSLADARCAG